MNPSEVPMTAAQIKSRAAVCAEFKRKGVSIAAWARDHGVSRSLVYSVLNDDRPRKCWSGMSHRVAVLLGLKDGELSSSTKAVNSATPSPHRRKSRMNPHTQLASEVLLTLHKAEGMAAVLKQRQAAGESISDLSLEDHRTEILGELFDGIERCNPGVATRLQVAMYPFSPLEEDPA